MMAQPSTTAWFCVRAQPRHEHIAAAHLRRTGEVEVFHPRVRFQRQTRRGKVSATESLFPGYLFARFEWPQRLSLVTYSTGVSGIVHFGNQWPVIPEVAIEDLRRCLGHQEVHEIPSTPEVGDTVEVLAGFFQGLQAVVTRVMPGRDRVAVLLDFLGRQTTVELETRHLAFCRPEALARDLNLAVCS